MRPSVFRKAWLVLALLLDAAGAVHAQDQTEEERLRELKTRFRKTFPRTPGQTGPKAELIDILREVADVDDPGALQFLIGLARDGRYVMLHADLLDLLVQRFSDSILVVSVMQERLREGDPLRSRAREFLIERAVERQDDPWLKSFFRDGTTEDRFLVLGALGRISSTETPRAAERLVRDPEWKPTEDGLVSCGTIAAALAGYEGPEAARLLLLLQRDPRFRERDAAAVREATRLWSRLDLKSYIAISELADPDPRKRAQSARLMGEAGIERARAPLLALATNEREPAMVRAEAAAALGGLRIARGDLAGHLAALARDADPLVRKGALEGLGRLRVRQSAVFLATLLDGPLAGEAREALAALSGEPPETEWTKWVASCDLPEGT